MTKLFLHTQYHAVFSDMWPCAADDDKLFDLQGSASFPDALSELGNLQEQPNDRQVGTVCTPFSVSL